MERVWEVDEFCNVEAEAMLELVEDLNNMNGDLSGYVFSLLLLGLAFLCNILHITGLKL